MKFAVKVKIGNSYDYYSKFYADKILHNSQSNDKLKTKQKSHN